MTGKQTKIVNSYRFNFDRKKLTTAIASDAKICVGDNTAMYATFANPYITVTRGSDM